MVSITEIRKHIGQQVGEDRPDEVGGSFELRGSDSLRVRRFTGFYNRARGELFRYALRIEKDPDMAEDIVQQAFANTLEAVESGKEIENLSAWMRRCILHLYLNHFRRDSIASFEDEDQIPSQASCSDADEMRGYIKEVISVVDKLPTHYRKALLMAELHGFCYEEIACEMERSVGSVAQIIRRARNQVRKDMARS